MEELIWQKEDPLTLTLKPKLADRRTNLTEGRHFDTNTKTETDKGKNPWNRTDHGWSTWITIDTQYDHAWWQEWCEDPFEEADSLLWWQEACQEIPPRMWSLYLREHWHVIINFGIWLSIFACDYHSWHVFIIFGICLSFFWHVIIVFWHVIPCLSNIFSKSLTNHPQSL